MKEKEIKKESCVIKTNKKDYEKDNKGSQIDAWNTAKIKYIFVYNEVYLTIDCKDQYNKTLKRSRK